jgi:hypothetical protein
MKTRSKLLFLSAKHRAAGVVAAVLLMAPLSAQAAEPKGTAMSACAADVASYCGGIEAGGGKKMRCLIDNKSRLTPACATTVEARLSERAARLGGPQMAQAQPGTAAPAPAAPPAAAATPAPGPAGKGAKGGNRPMMACRTDLATFCGDVPKGGGQKMKCLTDNQSKLSAECSAALTAIKDKRADAKADCRIEADALCPATKGPSRMQCLTQNRAKMSDACGKGFDKRMVKRNAAQSPPAGASPAPAPKQQ